MIVFVGGIHGVGKTYLCGPAAQKLGVLHASASQLIREEQGRETWTSDKRVAGIDENQAALIAAVDRIRKEGKALLLDGHFALRGPGNEPTRINPEVFRQLGVDEIILLTAEISIVQERNRARGDTSWTLSELQKLHEAEQTHAHDISRKLDLPIVELISPSQSLFIGTVERAFG